MTHSIEEQIRERAYHLWRSGGMAEGMAHEHWLHAERALLIEQGAPLAKAMSTKATSANTAVAKISTGTGSAVPKKTKTASATASSKPKASVATMVRKTPVIAPRTSNTIN